MEIGHFWFPPPLSPLSCERSTCAYIDLCSNNLFHTWTCGEYKLTPNRFCPPNSSDDLCLVFHVYILLLCDPLSTDHGLPRADHRLFTDGSTYELAVFTLDRWLPNLFFKFYLMIGICFLINASCTWTIENQHGHVQCVHTWTLNSILTT